MLTVCPDCRFTYVSDLPEDIAKHQERHARWQELTLPVHCPSLLGLGVGSAGALLVENGSPLWKHEHMYRCARAFKHEMRFDYVPWPDPHFEKIELSNPVREGQLIGDSEGRVFGAGCFELCGPIDDGEKFWKLKWVWVAPSERRNGRLRDRWSDWVSRYGEILPEHPISNAMKGFLRQIDWTPPPSAIRRGLDREAWLEKN